MKQTHSLATIFTQPESGNGIEKTERNETFPWLKKSDLKDIELPDIPMHFYKGSKKPCMPDETAKYTVSSLRFLAHQAVAVNVSKDKDIGFFKRICVGNVAEFAGFNTRLLRESGELCTGHYLTRIQWIHLQLRQPC